MSQSLRAILAAGAFACVLVAAPAALARGVVIDPDGLSLWDQIVSWFASLGSGSNDAGNSLDPWG